MAAGSKSAMQVAFWGTRGTLAAPGVDFQVAGGNTICAEVTCGDETIIFDAGTGIRQLGGKLIAERTAGKVNLLLTHAHYDHIEGIPFFAPLFSDRFDVEVWCGPLDGAADVASIIPGFMRRPYFPVSTEVFNANLTYKEVDPGQSYGIGESIEIMTRPLNHPGGATGYRVNFAGKSFAFVTDTEHLPGKTNSDVVELIRDVDMFIYDASLTDEELPEFTGYGHSTWEEGLRLAEAANAGRYFAYHHMPFRTDKELDAIDRKIAKQRKGSGVAREGMMIEL